MAPSALVVVVVVVLAAAGCSALPRRRLSKYISHYDVADYDKKAVHEAHTDFSTRWHKQETIPFEFKITIASHGRTFHLELHPDEEVFTHETQFLGADDKPIEFDRASVLVGRVADDPDSFVHGSILGGRFRGVITAHGDKYVVDPALAHFDEAQPFHSVMYKDSDTAHDQILGAWGNSSHFVEADGDGDNDEGMSGGESHSERFQDSIVDRIRHRSRRNADPAHLECQLNIAGDHTYSAEVARLEAYSITDKDRVRAAVIQTFASLIRQANSIISTTKFHSASAKAEGYRVAVQTARAFVNVDEMRAYRKGLAVAQSSASAVLNEWSQPDWNSYCLSYIFVHRDYDGSVLGLAYVARVCARHSPGSRPPSANTGTVTSLNAGQRLPAMTVSLVFVHELGHNWGSKHDAVATCLPSDSQGGLYIMSPNANSGNLPNHRKFSPCSITAIGRILATTSSRCFRPPSKGEICGNNVKEGDEECDCGVAGQCTAADLCCNRYSATSRTNNCKRKAGSKCVLQDGPCCTQVGNGDCSLTLTAANHTCSEAHECRIGVSICDGSSAACPRAPSREDGILCNRGRSTCQGGNCNNTLCAYANLQGCSCSGIDSCSVCCKSDGKCVPLRDIKGVNQTGLSRNLPPGSPCDNYKGACNFLNFCRRLDDISLLGTIANHLLNFATFQSAWTWAKSNWYYVLAGFIGIILFFSLVIHFFAKKTPRTVEVRRLAAGRGGGARNASRSPRAENLELVG